MDYLEFIETTAFSALRKGLMNDDELRELQTFLIENPEKGDTISHTGGCKKIRWGRQNAGKQGGIRIIYYLRLASGRIYLLLVFPKSEKSDLTGTEKMLLRAAVQKMK